MELNIVQMGTVYFDGEPQKIGAQYLFQQLSVGKTVPDEWDDALDEVGESQDIWHWKNIYFWGQERSKRAPAYGVIRGGYSAARRWTTCSAANHSADVGWRPVLEPLGPAFVTPERLLSKEVQVYGPGNIVLDGVLRDADDYDLTLRTPNPLPDNCAWAKRIGGQVIVNRPSVLWVKEKQLNPLTF